MSKFTIGADPEFFIVNSTGVLVKSSTITKAGKSNPEDLGNGYAVHADNVMIELSVPPSKTKEEFISTMEIGINRLKDYIHEKLPGAKLVIKPSKQFNIGSLTDDKDKEIGCDVDFNAYTGSVNPKPELDTLTALGLRYAGGHVHVGFNNDDELMDLDNQERFIRALDYLFLDFVRKFDEDNRRKIVYGTPGRFRIKDYGVEYRSLSNVWCQSKDKMGIVYDLVEEAVKNYKIYDIRMRNTIVKESFQSQPKSVGYITSFFRDYMENKKSENKIASVMEAE